MSPTPPDQTKTPLPPKPQPAQRPRQFMQWSIPRLVLALAAAVACYFYFDAVPMALRWPVRVLLALLSVWTLVALVRDLLWFTKVGGREFKRQWEALTRFFQAPLGSRIWRGWELSCALALVVGAGVHLALVYGSMATASLREDEIGSINQYASHGPFAVATQYRLAKNHIFYNLVSSLTPGSGSFHPLRGRLWSFIAVTGWFAAVLVWCWRRERYIEGAVIFALGALNLELLETLLESRGYGFIAAFAGVSVFFLINYLKSREDRWLILLSTLTILGTWTLPFYIVFAGVLHLALWLYRRDRATLLAGIFAAMGVVLVYLPVMGGLLEVTGEYDDKYGFKYMDFRAIVVTMQYLLPEQVYRLSLEAFVGAFVAIMLLPVLGRRSARAETRAGYMALAAALGFIVFCLVLQTPPMRVTSFIATPLAAILGIWLWLPLAGKRERPLRLVAAPALAALGLWASFHLVREYEYIPRQSWREGGQIIDQLFPPSAKVWVNSHYTELVQCSLRGSTSRMVRRDNEEVPPPINLGAVRRGKWVLFDALFKNDDQPARLGWEDAPTGARYVTLPLRVNYHRLWFCLPDAVPDQRGVGDVLVNGVATPLSLLERQAYDPVLLAKSAGPGDELYALDDLEPNGDPAPAALELLPAYLSGQSPDAVLGPPDPLEVVFTVPLRPGEGADSPKPPRDTENVGILFSQSIELKTVSATWTDVKGRKHSLGAGRIMKVGELVLLKLPAKALHRQEIREVRLRLAPEGPLSRRDIPYLRVLRDFDAQDNVLPSLPRPPLRLLEIWRGGPVETEVQ